MLFRSLEPAVQMPSRGASRWRRTVRQFTRNRLAVAGAVVLLLLLIVAVFGPFFVADPRAQDIPNRFQSPSWEHWFGTDEVGRDIFARTVHGARISLASALAAVLVSFGIGTMIGLVAGYLEGRTGLWLMALIDLLLAIPAILLARLPGFELRWIWYLSVGATIMQLCMNLLLLRREFRLRLRFA